MTITEHLLSAGIGITSADIDGHETDLYVRNRPLVMGFLRHNYPVMAENTRSFHSETDGDTWLDIPFGRMEFRTRK